MQKKTSGISPFLLVLMQIGLILTLLVWWGLLGKFPAAGRDTGAGGLGKGGASGGGTGDPAAGRAVAAGGDAPGGSAQRCPTGSPDRDHPVGAGCGVCHDSRLDHAGGRQRRAGGAGIAPGWGAAAVSAGGGLPLVLIWAAAIAVGWCWGERFRALEETADEAGQRSLVDRCMRSAFAGVGKYALLTVAWLLFFAVAWWVRTRFFR